MHLREKLAVKMFRNDIQVRCTGIHSPVDPEVKCESATSLAPERLLKFWRRQDLVAVGAPLNDLHVVAPHVSERAPNAGDGSPMAPVQLRNVVGRVLEEKVVDEGPHEGVRGHGEPVIRPIPTEFDR